MCYVGKNAGQHNYVQTDSNIGKHRIWENLFMISVLMPVYNAEKTLSDSISSVLNQTYTDFELIICNDGSTDRTAEIVAEFNDPRIIFISNCLNKGAAGARQCALSAAQGRFISFLDSDDVWHKDKLAVQLNFMSSNNVAFSFGDYHVFTHDVSSPVGFFKAPSTVSFDDLCRTCGIGCLTVMLDRELLGDFEMQNMPKEDYATWLSILRQGNVLAQKYPGALAYYRKSSGSLSSNKMVEISRQYNVLKNAGGLSGFKASFCLAYYIAHGLVKHLFLYRR